MLGSMIDRGISYGVLRWSAQRQARGRPLLTGERIGEPESPRREPTVGATMSQAEDDPVRHAARLVREISAAPKEHKRTALTEAISEVSRAAKELEHRLQQIEARNTAAKGKGLA